MFTIWLPIYCYWVNVYTCTLQLWNIEGYATVYLFIQDIFTRHSHAQHYGKHYWQARGVAYIQRNMILIYAPNTEKHKTLERYRGRCVLNHGGLPRGDEIFRLAFGKRSRAWQTNPNSRGIIQRKKKKKTAQEGTEVWKEQRDLGDRA